MHTEKKQ